MLSKYKRLVLSTRYNKSPYTARVMLSKTGSLHLAAQKQICRNICREVHLLCSIKNGGSILRNTSPAALANFSWKLFIAELKSQAPTLYAIVKSAVTKPQKSPNLNSVGIIAAVLLNCRSRVLSQVQAVVSILLYAGHCSKQVTYKTACSYCMHIILISNDVGVTKTKSAWFLLELFTNIEKRERAGERL